MSEFNLNFMHPQYGTTLNVDIDASFTIDEMIQNLLLSGFINENQAGYDLALREQMLDRTATFEEIQELYDGAVIRIIAHHQEDGPKPNFLKLHIKHPSETLVLNLNHAEELPLSNVIQQATDKHFVQGDVGILHLQKGEKLLDLNKTAAENGVLTGDYLQLIHGQPTENPIQTAVGQLDQKLQQLEAQIEQQLTNIKNALPAANMIPIDPTRAVNPTMETYESIDTIVNRLRKASNEEALKPIRPFPMFLLWIGAILFCILIVIILISTNII